MVLSVISASGNLFPAHDSVNCHYSEVMVNVSIQNTFSNEKLPHTHVFYLIGSGIAWVNWHYSGVVVNVSIEHLFR